MESAAISILLRAVEMDTKERYTMALVLYQEGLQILMDLIKGQYKKYALQSASCLRVRQKNDFH